LGRTLYLMQYSMTIGSFSRIL